MASSRSHAKTAPSTPIARHRARRARQGFARVEVSVRHEDAALLRQVAAVLTDPPRRAAIRAAIQPKAVSGLDLKELLASMPEGLELIRSRDRGRRIDL